MVKVPIALSQPQKSDSANRFGRRIWAEPMGDEPGARAIKSKPARDRPARGAEIRDLGAAGPEPARRRRAVAGARFRDPGGDRAQPRRHRACRIVEARRFAQFHHLPSGQDHGVARLCAPVKESKRYRIGRPLFALAASALDEMEMVSLATPMLEELSRETGESAHFSVRMGDAVVVLARTSGPGAFQLDRPRRRGAAGALHGARQDHARRPAPTISSSAICATPNSRRRREIDHLGRTAARARSPKCAAPAWPSTTANSMPKCAAWRCRCAISPAR